MSYQNKIYRRDTVFSFFRDTYLKEIIQKKFGDDYYSPMSEKKYVNQISGNDLYFDLGNSSILTLSLFDMKLLIQSSEEFLNSNPSRSNFQTQVSYYSEKLRRNGQDFNPLGSKNDKESLDHISDLINKNPDMLILVFFFFDINKKIS